MEAKFIAFSRATTQALWIAKYFEEINLPISKPIIIYANNNVVISNSMNDKNHCHTKHIDVHYHFIKKQVDANDVLFKHILSSENMANFLTKPLPRDALHKTATISTMSGCYSPGGVSDGTIASSNLMLSGFRPN